MNKAVLSKEWKDSFVYSSSIMAAIMALLDVCDLSIGNIDPPLLWWKKLLVILIIYVAITLFVRLYIKIISNRKLKLDVRGISVTIKSGDIFSANGWKLIPFNEYYDTLVNDKVISRNSLNGIFIERHVKDINELNAAISIAKTESSYFPHYVKEGRLAFPLGRIITYKDYLMLAFAHFDERNVAHISRPEYEQCLFNMWKEIRRVYANKPINIPLIGSGITSFDDLPEKSNSELLKCILCTLQTSGENFNQPITIILTPTIMKEINTYRMKGVII